MCRIRLKIWLILLKASTRLLFKYSGDDACEVIRLQQSWFMRQKWHDVCFMHWQIPVEMIREHIPKHLMIDTYDGQAYVGIVSFHVTGLRLRWLPPIPLFSSFTQMNVRTYVTAQDGRPGVWFFRLIVPYRLAVIGAKLLYQLPFEHQSTSIDTTDNQFIRYTVTSKQIAAEYRHLFHATCKPVGDPYDAPSQSFERWLTERYYMYSGEHDRTELTHHPWKLQRVEAELTHNQLLFSIFNKSNALRPSHVLFAKHQHAVISYKKELDQ